MCCKNNIILIIKLTIPEIDACHFHGEAKIGLKLSSSQS